MGVAEDRRAWVHRVAACVLAALPPIRLGAWRDQSPGFSDVDRALAYVHVGVAHFRGVAPQDMDVPDGLLDAAAVRQLAVQSWRLGAGDVRVLLTLDATWLALYDLGCAFNLLAVDFATPLARWAPTVTAITPIDFSPLPPAGGGAAASPSPSHGLDEADVWLQQVPALDESTLDFPVTALERYWSVHHDVSLPTWASETVAGVIELPLVLEWPDAGARIPDWVRDLAVGANGRAFPVSSGAVVEWIFVAETAEEAMAMSRSAYEPEVRIGHEGTRTVMVYTLPLQNEPHGMITIGYPLDALLGIAAFIMIAVVRRVRIDLFRLDETGTLQYDGSWWVDVPDEVAKIIGVLARRAYEPSKPLMTSWASDIDRIIDQVAAAERAAFESLWAVDAVASKDPSGQLHSCWTEYLEAHSSAAAAASQGAPIDEAALRNARERVIAERNRSVRPEHRAAIEHLERGEAYLTVTYVQETLPRMEVRAVWNSDEGPDGRDFDVSDKIHLLAGSLTPDDLAERLMRVLDDVSDLRNDGIHRLFLNVAGALYDLPFHDALLRNGFERVAYTHSLDRVGPRSAVATATATVYGSAGEASGFLETLDLELDLVAESWSTSRASTLDLSDTGPIVHLAGHGRTGPAQWEIILQVDGPRRAPLSATDVLLSQPTAPPALVVLSACSTGAAQYSALQPMESVPLDIAFLQRGADCVISTGAPVNDYIATFFAIVLHTEVVKRSDVWAAYTLARRCCANLDVVDESADLRAKLDARWPCWRDHLDAVAPQQRNDWRLYRVVGRPGPLQ